LAALLLLDLLFVHWLDTAGWLCGFESSDLVETVYDCRLLFHLVFDNFDCGDEHSVSWI